MGILDDIDSAAYDIIRDTFVHCDAFHHSTTTSRHVRRFLSAMVGRVNWDALYKACNKACDDETINGNGEQFINVSQFTY